MLKLPKLHVIYYKKLMFVSSVFKQFTLPHDDWWDGYLILKSGLFSMVRFVPQEKNGEVENEGSYKAV